MQMLRDEDWPMIAILSTTSIASGIVLACLAERHPRFVARLETMGGVCFIGGLAVIGGALPIFR